MASQEERKKFVERFIASPEIAALPPMQQNIYRGQALKLVAVLGLRPISELSTKDLDELLAKLGRAPEAAIAEKVGLALLKYVASQNAPPPQAASPSPPAPIASPPAAPAGKPIGSTTIQGMTLQRGLNYKTEGPVGAAIKGRMMAGILSTGRMFARRGTPLDLSLKCLSVIDEYFDEEAPGGQPKASSELSTNRQATVLAIAAYVSAVLANAVGGGQIEVDENDPEAELNLSLVLPNGKVLHPVMRVIGRLDLGRGQSLAAYGDLAVHAR